MATTFKRYKTNLNLSKFKIHLPISNGRFITMGTVQFTKAAPNIPDFFCTFCTSLILGSEAHLVNLAVHQCATTRSLRNVDFFANDSDSKFPGVKESVQLYSQNLRHRPCNPN